MDITINRKFVVKVFIIIIALLFTAHMCGWVWENVFNHNTAGGIVDRFDINNENSVPTWYSSSALMVCGLLLGVISVVKKKSSDQYALHWGLLAMIFIFLSCDESATLHETTVRHVYNATGNKFLRFIGWVVPYSILFIIFMLSYLKFLLNLPKNIKLMFIGSCATYVLGALGMELIKPVCQGFWGRSPLSSFLFDMAEEILEMGGVVFFIYTLLCYIDWYVGEISVRIVGDSQKEEPK